MGKDKKLLTENGARYFVEDFEVKGCYFLIRGGRIVYVGMSKYSIINRINDHLKERVKLFDSFKLFPMPNYSDKQVAKFEKAKIKKYKPEYNVIYNKTDFNVIEEDYTPSELKKRDEYIKSVRLISKDLKALKTSDTFLNYQDEYFSKEDRRCSCCLRDSSSFFKSEILGRNATYKRVGGKVSVELYFPSIKSVSEADYNSTTPYCTLCAKTNMAY